MKTKQLMISALATLLALGFSATAFASSFNSSEAGNWDYSFNQPVNKADEAAKNHNYNPEDLAKVGTEEGIDSFETPQADKAAQSHNYDQGRLAGIGTEAGVSDS